VKLELDLKDCRIIRAALREYAAAYNQYAEVPFYNRKTVWAMRKRAKRAKAIVAALDGVNRATLRSHKFQPLELDF
jgi:hypothetical protein